MDKQDDLETALLNWFKQARSQNVPRSGPLMLERCNELAKQMGITFSANPGCYLRVFGNGFRNFEPWLSDEDDTRAGNPLSQLTHNPNRSTFELLTDLTCITPLCGRSSVVLGYNS
ncbi:hypothetical protein TNCV_1214491 [Trichonephila clavipes]|nr:hypothetical protein TNCV_1214491 [Trichonephila clavipes]